MLYYQVNECYNLTMKKLIYHSSYFISLILVGCGGVISLIYTIINIPTLSNLSDSILFILCFILFTIFSVFQCYTVLRSYKHEGVFLKGLLYGKENDFAKKTYIAVNVIIVLGLFLVIYGLLLFLGLDIPFNTFPKELDLLLVVSGVSLIVNGTFTDLYPLVKALDKES